MSKICTSMNLNWKSSDEYWIIGRMRLGVTMLLFIFVLLFSISSDLFSSECVDVNLYTTSDKLSSIELVQQGEMGTCYAHTLSNLINYELPKADHVFAYDIAFTHKNFRDRLHWSPRSLNYSLQSMAWKDFKRIGSCDQELYERSMNSYRQNLRYSDDQFFFFLKYFFKINKKKRISGDVESLSIQLLEKLIKKTRAKYAFAVSWTIKDVLALTESVHPTAKDKSMFEWFEKVLFKNCREVRKRDDLKQLRYHKFGRLFKSKNKIRNKIDRILSEEKAISIGLCASTLENLGSQNFVTLPRVLKSFKKKKCRPHYVILAGSRTRKNKCEYLIRNSYTHYFVDHSMPCFCENKKTGEKKDCGYDEFSKKKENLKILGCWYGRDKVIKNSYDFGYLEKK